MAASFPSLSLNNNKWYFTREQIENSPSRRAGLDPDKELSYRQQAANLLQDMGQRLNVSQLTINTAIVYMHRFYMIQSFTRFHRNVIAPAALFLAAKVEEQPRKLEHVIKVTHACLNPQDPSPDIRSDTYLQQAQDLVILESIILQTLAFEITIDHPHTHVVKCTQLVRGENHLLTINCASYCSVMGTSSSPRSKISRLDYELPFIVPASKDLAQTSYFMATNSLHLTTFCLQYSPPIVACVCIHLACKWSNWEIPVSTDGKHWWEYVDPTVTLELLDELTHEFLQILEKTPSRLKRIRNWKAAGQTTKKSKLQDGDQSEAILNMISMASSDSTLAGLMSLSAPPSGSSMDSSADDHSVAPSSQHWQPPAKEQPTTNELHAPAKLSLNEYRVKHADELAAQKRKLENMEASVKQGYATATQALMNQQRKEKHHHHQQSSSSSSDLNNPSPIVLKIPLDERTERRSIKMRLAVPGQSSSGGNSSSSSSRGSEPDIKVRIRVPERRSGSGEDGKSREKHRERSNHHHHHHHHSSSSTTGSLSASSSSSSAQKHSSSASASGSSKKVSGDSMRTSSSSSSSRKRTHLPDPSSGSHSSKVSKSSRNSFQLPTLPGVPSHAMGQGSDILPSLSLSHHQGNYSHSKLDKADTNGHNTGSQSNEYQDTFDMLNSLLSAQGVQPAQPQMFDYRSQYGEYRYSSSARGGTQAPPLPSEPPPPLPPLPK
ncbi:cyclin-T1 isoform X1 [Sinocyclocheilus anshuiensis]|uniref:cyclin-T1 isoform X1 n=1 Tax=Sinocyclocheilus anshuiensis TaxID=1608454 RepID=UPI0007B9B948|nr:PREDICTED: cyclin-T1-like isoform X1 [Sinocyclocheilus anshuiensis]